MMGRRVPDGTDVHAYHPGDYGLRGSRWWVCLPTGVLGALDDRWQVVEVEERITVSPSINLPPSGWHGFLIDGQWQVC
jgi:hypothetical protein